MKKLLSVLALLSMFIPVGSVFASYTVDCPRCGYMAQFTGNTEYQPGVSGRFLEYQCTQGHVFMIHER